MTIKLSIAAALLCLFAIPSHALAKRQAISTSMAECTALFIQMSSIAEARGKVTNQEKADRWANDFFKIAYTQAKGENIPDPRNHIDNLVGEYLPDWDKRIKNILKLNETKDWIDYCKSLGKSKGLTFK